MDNLETRAFGTQDTGRRQKKTNKAQYSPENQKDEQHGPHKNTGMANSCAQVGPTGTWLPPWWLRLKGEIWDTSFFKLLLSSYLLLGF
jgi:hypothetical protein